ncbi:MAG: hypothetical protein K2J10_11815, partial [Muribaculaceae bacterium]|nr:hypothetical protein [Muribaculaceae bacterium]
TMKRILTLALALGLTIAAYSADRWTILPDRPVISKNVRNQQLPHADHIEMSGDRMAVVLYWDLDSNATFGLNRALVFPMLRTVPNDTHASLMLNNDLDVASMLRINSKRPMFAAENIVIDGMMKVSSVTKQPDGSIVELMRTIFPTTDHQVMIEIYSIKNIGDKPANIIIPELSQRYATDPHRGVKGSYIIDTRIDGSGSYNLAPSDAIDFTLTIQAYEANGGKAEQLDPNEELAKRKSFVDFLDSNLVLHTPDEAIDTEFRYAKLRGAESIYKTKGGYMHGPGGESYYAALWCNDQAEYINPFFPFLGYGIGNESALNCFRHYARFMNDEYRPIPSSIIAEGDDIWNGAGDRGDAAMLAYGASRYALARGDKAEANELWPLIEWCLEYCRRQLNSEGVVKSDHDELEGRFPAGDANLCTASLYY